MEYGCVITKAERVPIFIEPWHHDHAVDFTVPEGTEAEVRMYYPGKGKVAIDIHYPRHTVTAVMSAENVHFHPR